MKKKKCSKCGELKQVSHFYKNRARYDGFANYCKCCSSKVHKNEYSKTVVTKQCHTCDTVFTGGKNKKFCSHKCRAASLKKEITGYKVCSICNKEFPFRETLKVRGVNGIASIRQKFCSKECARIAKIEWNKSFRMTESQKKKVAKKISNTLKGRQVSVETRKKLSDRFKGDKSHFWKGGITSQNKLERNSLQYKLWRKAVFERDDYTCQKCGIRGTELHADHIKPFAIYHELRYDIDNGRTLCVSCHKNTDTFAGRVHSLLAK